MISAVVRLWLEGRGPLWCVFGVDEGMLRPLLEMRSGIVERGGEGALIVGFEAADDGLKGRVCLGLCEQLS